MYISIKSNISKTIRDKKKHFMTRIVAIEKVNNFSMSNFPISLEIKTLLGKCRTGTFCLNHINKV